MGRVGAFIFKKKLLKPEGAPDAWELKDGSIPLSERNNVFWISYRKQFVPAPHPRRAL
jgi:hypothetical protein